MVEISKRGWKVFQERSYNKTLEYYDKNAEDFVRGTLDVDFTKIQNRFLNLLPQEGRILDFGCGSGRDARYFHEKGFHVDAVDGSAELCRLARKLTGIDVRQMLFKDLDKVESYDGIWACSSILHLPSSELSEVLLKMIRALRRRGIIYTSFKYGESEGIRNGRYFTDFTEGKFDNFIAGIDGLRIMEYWITEDVRPGRGDEKWLNLILQKTNIH